MSGLQFTLFFAALLVGYVLVHLRMIRFEEHLQKLSSLRNIEDRICSLDAHVEQMAQVSGNVNLERVTKQLERLHEDLEDLREATSEVRSAIVHIPMPEVIPAGGESGTLSEMAAVRAESAGTRIVGLIETALLQLGYRKLRLLGDLSDVQFGDEIEVQVEVERNGMPFKGRVVMRNGSVHDVNVQSVAQSFP